MKKKVFALCTMCILAMTSFVACDDMADDITEEVIDDTDVDEDDHDYVPSTTVSKLEGQITDDTLTVDSPYYAVIMLEDGVELVLTTDEVYDDNGENHAINSSVYIVNNGELVHQYDLEAGGTAYPISFDDEGIYVGGGHWLDYYEIENGKLVLDTSVHVEYDSDGNETYTATEGGIEEDEPEQEWEELWNQFMNSTPVAF